MKHDHMQHILYVIGTATETQDADIDKLTASHHPYHDDPYAVNLTKTGKRERQKGG